MSKEVEDLKFLEHLFEDVRVCYKAMLETLVQAILETLEKDSDMELKVSKDLA